MTKRFFFLLATISLLLSSLDSMAESRELKNAWYEWGRPYQYVEKGNDGISRLTGLDVELSRAITAEARFPMRYDPLSWANHRQHLLSGQRDLACGVTKSDDLSPYVYYSKPYRTEYTGFFMKKSSPLNFHYSSVEDFIKGIKDNNFRLGVVKGFVYADDQLNAFIDNPNNGKYIIPASTTKENLEKLLTGSIDGFLSERLSGATTVWEEGQTSQMVERQLGSASPIHIALSRETMTPEDLESFNTAIDILRASGRYDQLYSQYLHPLILLQTLDSNWFFIIGTFRFEVERSG